MTLLRFLAGLFGGITVVYAEHIGDVHQHLDVVEPDDDCDCGGHDPDGPESVAVVMTMPQAKELFTEAAHRGRNADDPDEVGWQMARELELSDPEDVL